MYYISTYIKTSHIRHIFRDNIIKNFKMVAAEHSLNQAWSHSEFWALSDGTGGMAMNPAFWIVEK